MTITLNFTIKQGDTFEWLFLVNDINGTPLDMSGFTGETAGVRGMLRKYYTDTTPKATFDTFILNKTGIEAAIAAGTCHLTTAEIAALKADVNGSCYALARMDADVTAGLAKGAYVYDIEIEDTTGFVFTPYVGSFTVNPEATK